jgi:RHS repeat-associated protein
MYWDFGGPTVIADTSSLTTRRPWYSMVYNDAVQGLALSPYGMTDASRYQVQHLAGQKQYELTNHLGNVQATISDLPVKVGEAHTEYHAPALPAVYDYYPFGMLMPDRYTSDTSSECVTVSQTKWVTTWVTHCYLAADWVWPAYSYYGSVSVSTSSGLQIAAGESSGIYFEIDVLPYEQQDVYLQTDAFYSGSGTLELQEYHSGQWHMLGSTTFDKLGEVRISIRPREDRIRAVLRGPFYVQVKQFCVQRPQLSQETVLVDICDTDGDKYRFGYNNMPKDNEIAGIGNTIDYKARQLDTRIGRFWSVDPLTKKFPELTPYQFASNTPIQAIDLDGKEAFFIHGTASSPSAWSPVLTNLITKNFTNNTHQDATFSWEDRNQLTNNKSDRRWAAVFLVQHILDYRKNNNITDEEITLIGHSHGGNIAIQAADIFHKFYNTKVNIVNFNTPAYNGTFDAENPQYNYGINSLTHFWTRQDGVAGGFAGDDKYTKGNLTPMLNSQNIELKNPLQKGWLKSHYQENINTNELLQHKRKPAEVPSGNRNPEEYKKKTVNVGGTTYEE